MFTRLVLYREHENNTLYERLDFDRGRPRDYPRAITNQDQSCGRAGRELAMIGRRVTIGRFVIRLARDVRKQASRVLSASVLADPRLFFASAFSRVWWHVEHDARVAFDARKSLEKNMVVLDARMIIVCGFFEQDTRRHAAVRDRGICGST